MSDRLPVVVNTHKGRFLVRGIPTALLCWMVTALLKSRKVSYAFTENNQPNAIKALALEALRRPETNRRVKFHATILSSPPCACGRAGLYVVGTETFCSKCRGQAAKALAAQGHRRGFEAREADYSANKKADDYRVLAPGKGRNGMFKKAFNRNGGRP